MGSKDYIQKIHIGICIVKKALFRLLLCSELQPNFECSMRDIDQSPMAPLGLSYKIYDILDNTKFWSHIAHRPYLKYFNILACKGIIAHPFDNILF